MGLASFLTRITVAGFMKSHPSAAHSSTLINLTLRQTSAAVADFKRLPSSGQFVNTVASTLYCGDFFIRPDSEPYQRMFQERKWRFHAFGISRISLSKAYKVY